MPTISEAIQTAQISQHEAKIILAFILKQSKAYLITNVHQNLTEVEADTFSKLIKRRQAGEPIAYLTGVKEFYGRPFIVSPSVLIPRPESELFIEIIKELSPANPVTSALDIGTGSGCLAITISKEHPGAKVTALDNSQEALKVAQQNNAQLETNVKLLKSDLLEQIPKSTHVDYIVANLPYIDPNDPEIMPQVAEYEPSEALYSNQNGLAHYAKLFNQIKAKSISFNYVLCEVGHKQQEAMTALIQKTFAKTPTWRYDLSGKPRICILNK
jgi:release factor glutamine methyltransferase